MSRPQWPRQRRWRLRGHTGPITFLAFAADGKTLASGSQDGTARLWDLGATGAERLLALESSGAWDVAFSLPLAPDALAGVYLVKLSSDDGFDSHVPFVVVE